MNGTQKRINIIIIFICTLFFINALEAQDQWGWQSLHLTEKNESDWLDLFASRDSGEKSFAIQSKTKPETPIFYRTQPGAKWIQIPEQAHLHGQKDWVSELVFIDANQLQLKCEAEADLKLFCQIAFSSKKSIDAQIRRCACDSLEVRGRNTWCPDGSCPPDPTPIANLEEFLIVHHSAGATDATDFDAVVRSYYRFHVEGNGWDDIGYNYLVSPDGNVYEGRGDFLLGAHFCGTNGNTSGICMIGNYVDRFPSESAVRKLTKLLAYKSCQIGVNPAGMAFHNSSNRQLRRISGHRDGCSTACPGQVLYDFLPFLTDLAENHIQDSCNQLEAPILRLESIDGNEAQLSWSDPYPDESGFFIELSIGNESDFNYIDDVMANRQEALINYGNDLPVYFRVRASFNGIPGPYSNVVSSEFTGIAEPQLRNRNEADCQLIDRLGRVIASGKRKDLKSLITKEGKPEWLIHCP
ncbi:MAG TPA: N-acetylmuramoyl-L-alanine amidase [Saprospiraceae bacterium]|nr:N-acetylmuramoyl-L-alanine amidase [Saprospiraceae bacterium]